MIPASDLQRGLAVIRSLRLEGPSDGPDAFTIPRDPEARIELCDLIYDLADEHAARAVMDLPRKPYRVDFG